MHIRKATIDDLMTTWEWYKDKTTRKMSGNKEKMNFSSHEVWYKDYLDSQTRCLLIGEDDKKNKIGATRFDVIGPNSYQTSITLSPEMRGKGLSSVFLEQSIIFLSETAGTLFFATIRKENESSIKCFEKVGFQYSHADDGFNYYAMTL